MLTERMIRDAKPRSRPYILWDSRIKGLGVKVTPGGTQTFLIDYRTDGRQRRATIGRPSEISLADARHRAASELDAIRNSGDDPLQRKRERREAPTLADACSQFFEEYTPDRIRQGRMTPRTEQTYRYQAAKYLLPYLGRHRIRDITRTDIERTVSPLPPTTRNRVLAFASRLFTTCELWEWRDQHTNPCRFATRARLEVRDRVLSPDEMSRLARALSEIEDRHPAPVAAIRFCALTGLRISEVLAIRWEDIDAGNGIVHLPRTKSGARSHHIPEPASAIISALPRFCDWVFSSGGGTRKGALTYSHTRKVFAAVCEAAYIKNARLHDLRRGIMLAAAEAGANAAVLRDLLGHSSLTMANRYLSRLGQPVREAREDAAAKIAAAMAVQASR